MAFDTDHIARQELEEPMREVRPKFPGLMKVGMAQAPTVHTAPELFGDIDRMLATDVTGAIAPAAV